MTEERDSQLSAMFDGELPAGECELLARRLTRDEALRAQWSRYSMIGAALRAERGVALHDRVAWKVQSAVAQEVTYGQENDNGNGVEQSASAAASTVRSARGRWQRFTWPVAGAGIAASVAALSIFWLQGVQEPGDTVLAEASPQTILLTPEPATTLAANTPAEIEQPSSNGEPGAYSTPAPNGSSSLAPPARLANYVDKKKSI